MQKSKSFLIMPPPIQQDHRHVIRLTIHGCRLVAGVGGYPCRSPHTVGDRRRHEGRISERERTNSCEVTLVGDRTKLFAWILWRPDICGILYRVFREIWTQFLTPITASTRGTRT